MLDRLHLVYLVTGSIASMAYGEPRFTNDIDIVVELPLDRVADFCAGFPSEDFYISPPAVAQAVQSKHQFNVLHPASGLKIDFIILTNSEFDSSRRQRARNLAVLSDRNVSFASPEDVILKKMIYYREGASEKHLRDIASMIRIQGTALDTAYITDWAGRLGVHEIWQAIQERAAES